DLVGGDQPGAERIEGLAGLAFDPLASALQLEFTLGHVVGDRVSGDDCGGILRRVQVAGRTAEYHGQFDLVVGAGAATRDEYLVLGADHRVGGLGEDHRFGRWFRPALGGVVGVVDPDTHHLAGAGHRGTDPKVAGRRRLKF